MHYTVVALYNYIQEVIFIITPEDLARLRECFRLLTKKLGLLEKSESLCCGVTLSQCHAIVEIGKAGTISVNDLANTLGLDKSTMSRSVNGLVEQRLASREPDPADRRYMVIELTGTGRALFLNIEDRMEQYYHIVYDSLPADRRGQVLESLELLVKALPQDQCC